jgi:hypothetical protein
MNRCASRYLKQIIFVASATLLAGCAIFGNIEDPAKKNVNIKYETPDSPFEKLDTTNTDSAWQSSVTGNTIAVNSTCAKGLEKDPKDLQISILSGVENLKIESDQPIKVDGNNGRRVIADGRTDGINIRADIVTLKKGECAYDLSYIGRKKTFDAEHATFEKFIGRFQIP